MEFLCARRGSGKSTDEARRFLESIGKFKRDGFDIFYVRMSEFVKLYALNKEMFIFNNLNFKYYFKGTDIEIYFTENLPEGVKGFFANKSYLKGGE